MDVKSKIRFARMSPLKGRPLARKIQGLPVSEALKVTDFNKRKAAGLLGKALKAAIANAENNHDLSVDDLHVKTAVINDGPRLKRYWARARGSVSPVQRRLCHVEIVVSDGNDDAGPEE